jgi:PQQ-dependent catabolism-associated CXXCW motif protein
MKCLLVAALIAATPCLAAVTEPDGYRMDHYRGPVPETVHGATVVHTSDLPQLIATRHPVLIDVLPAPSPPPDARPGLPRMPLPHRDIPGSLWLPDVGRGALSAQTDAWFRAQLDRATHGNRNVPVVFYCLSNCWMSWNATKRAVGYGYAQAFWYPEGADGWIAAGKPTQIAHPESGGE